MNMVQRLLSHWVRTELGVQLPDSQQLVTVRVRPNDTIKHIRLHLVRQGVTSWKMSFTYKGRELGENETLEESNITSGAVLVLVKDGHSPPSTVLLVSLTHLPYLCENPRRSCGERCWWMTVEMGDDLSGCSFLCHKLC
ncbi:ubiquitin domain-containing protein TINCR-like [Pristis pectinata]|uniref:ubiquitin domain-containing protein TINCR-like n=1 Tax=Pristis pectinata TaxID=685728 RepID=UPI00223CA9FD|nr:ubiquitin domain-containing protein TINCR-like [Pristis pectinata]